MFDFDIDIQQIIRYIMSPELQELLFPVRVIFIIFFWLGLASICYFLIKTSYLKTRYFEDSTHFWQYKGLKSKKITKQWKKIIKRIESNNAAGWKLSIIEADNLLDSVLERIGCVGANREERIGAITSDLIPEPYMTTLKEVHNIRNAIINDPDYQLEQKITQQALKVYLDVFKHLGLF